MKKRDAITVYLLLTLFLITGSGASSAQSINDIKVPDPGKPVCAYCGTSDLSRHARAAPITHLLQMQQPQRELNPFIQNLITMP
jgi:hypothetical protein